VYVDEGMHEVLCDWPVLHYGSHPDVHGCSCSPTQVQTQAVNEPLP